MRLADVDFLKVTSSDKREFILGINAVVLCPGFIKMVEMAASAPDRIAEASCPYPKHILKAVIEYVYYKMRYLGQPDYSILPPFHIAPNLALEVFKASRDLGI